MTLDEKLEMLRLLTEEAKERLDDLSERLQITLENATESVAINCSIDKHISYTAEVVAELAILGDSIP